MKPNRYMLMLAVRAARERHGLLAGDSAGGKAATASFTDTSGLFGLLRRLTRTSRPQGAAAADAEPRPQTSHGGGSRQRHRLQLAALA